ncbi:MAG: hypothetical protein ACJAS9_002742 [Polaribacter sp.]|jgi:hypothetical protein
MEAKYLAIVRIEKLGKRWALEQIEKEIDRTH